MHQKVDINPMHSRISPAARVSTVRYSADELKPMREAGEGRSDWDRVRKLTDEEIERAVAGDPDAGTFPESWPEGVEIGLPKPKERITVRLDTNVLN